MSCVFSTDLDSTRRELPKAVEIIEFGVQTKKLRPAYRFIPNYTSVFFFGILLFLVGFVALPTCLEIFPGLDVFAVTASLSFPVLVTVLT